jgi:hypothetical protein
MAMGRSWIRPIQNHCRRDRRPDGRRSGQCGPVFSARRE